MGYDLHLKAELKGTFISLEGNKQEKTLTEYYDLWQIGDEKEVLEILGQNRNGCNTLVSKDSEKCMKNYCKYIKQLEYIEETEKQYHLKELKEFVMEYSKLGYKIIWYVD